MLISSARDMEVNKIEFGLAKSTYQVNAALSKSEKYALADQIRVSSRLVCANLREAWTKRCFPSLFLSKLTDADDELNETKTWLDFAFY